MVRGALDSGAGPAAIEGFFKDYCAEELNGAPKVLTVAGHSFSDLNRKVVSIINLASVAAVETMERVPIDPLRFRANLYVDGWPAWSELDLVGETLSVGAAVRLKVVKRIVRCAATDVVPGAGIRDTTIPQTLMRNLGHADCGVYAEVIAGGPIAAGDRIAPSGKD